MVNYDYVKLFYDKFKIDLPIKDNNFNSSIFFESFKYISIQSGIVSIIDSYKVQSSKYKKNKNLECKILKKEDESYEMNFELKKYNKVLMSIKINSNLDKCKVETFYSKSIKKHFKNFKIKNDNYLYITELMDKDIHFIEDYEIIDNINELKYKSFVLNGVNYELQKEISFLSSSINSYIDYSMDMKISIKNYYLHKDGFNIVISFNNEKIYKKINTVVSEYNNISEQVCDYLNENNKKFENLTEKDFELIKILKY